MLGKAVLAGLVGLGLAGSALAQGGSQQPASPQTEVAPRCAICQLFLAASEPGAAVTAQPTGDGLILHITSSDPAARDVIQQRASALQGILQSNGGHLRMPFHQGGKCGGGRRQMGRGMGMGSMGQP